MALGIDVLVEKPMGGFASPEADALLEAARRHHAHPAGRARVKRFKPGGDCR